MTQEEKYMKAAIKQAKKAEALHEAASLSMRTGSSDGDTTAGSPTRTFWPMRRSSPSEKHAGS